MTNRPDYYSIKAISNSALKNFTDYSPRKALYLMQNGIKETEALITGRAIHKAVLEADTFFEEFEYLPDGFTLRSKENKAIYQQIIDSGKTPLSNKQKILIDALCNRILESKNSQILLKGIPEKEYFGEIDGHKVKCKVDLVNPDKGYIVDLKTTLDVNPEVFLKECEKRQYFQQAWFYRHMANLNGENIKKFFFINIEKEPPYSMSIVEISDSQFAIGQEQFTHNFSLYKFAVDNPTRDFDALPTGQKHWQIEEPNWMIKKYGLEGLDD